MRLTGAGDPAVVYGQYVSANLFDLLGVVAGPSAAASCRRKTRPTARMSRS